MHEAVDWFSGWNLGTLSIGSYPPPVLENAIIPGFDGFVAVLGAEWQSESQLIDLQGCVFILHRATRWKYQEA